MKPRIKPSTLPRWLDLALKASADGGADGTLVALAEHHSALTRFANNTIHQNVSETNSLIMARVDLGARRGLATTSQLTEDAVHAVIGRAIELAKRAPALADRPPLPGPQRYRMIDRWDVATAQASPAERGEAVANTIQRVERAGFTAAGYLTTASSHTALVNSNGLSASMPSTFAEFAITVMAPGSSGWAKAKAPSLAELRIDELTEQAIRTAERGREPRELPAGSYPVILAPAAVADLLSFLAGDFGGLAVLEQESCLTGQLGRRLFGSNITLYDDVGHPLQMGDPFDGEGVARQTLPLIESGVVRSFVYGLTSAKKAGVPPTGHGSAVEPDDYPQNLVLQGGASSIEEMIASTERGIFITRCWYIREVDPTQKIVTGMTRDGTFWIEEGAIAHGVKNLRFNQGLIAMLNDVEAMGPAVRAAGEEHESCIVVPAMKIRNFRFTGTTPD
ncbi:MAG TPA: TldD/PmbA family protein [Nitrospiria bacterium]|nr:TldD/PmbA family protein [Nitrospiria bacterium]